MLRRKVNDTHLRELLNKVHLGYLEGREQKNGGFDSINEWGDVFSGGER